MNCILTLERLKKTYHGKTVLNVDHMEIEEGKITAVIGPSGAGKTTLLSIINGLEKPDEGRVIFRGEEFSANRNYSAAAVKQMAMVFQKPVMFKTTVYNNIAYGLRTRNIKRVSSAKGSGKRLPGWGFQTCFSRKRSPCPEGNPDVFLSQEQ